MKVVSEVIEANNANDFTRKVAEFYEKHEHTIIKSEYSVAIDSSGKNKSIIYENINSYTDLCNTDLYYLFADNKI